LDEREDPGGEQESPTPKDAEEKNEEAPAGDAFW
jgi:hypothetical protein